jgi:hypothetical protein
VNGDPARTDATAGASPTDRRFWINTVSLDHVEAAAEGGFTQGLPFRRGLFAIPREDFAMISAQMRS